MTRAGEAWATLNQALVNTDPACLNDGRFILDDIPAFTVKYLCDECPLYELCHEYARTARPTGGIWAGKRWGKKGLHDENA